MPKYGLRKARPDWRIKDSWKPIIGEILARHPDMNIVRLNNGRGLKDRAAWIRFEIWWTIKERTGASILEIGKRLGDFDHTSVAYGLRQYNAMLAQQRCAA